MTLDDVILRHGGESQKSRDAYAALPSRQSAALQAFLNSLVLFPPDEPPSPPPPDDPPPPLTPAVPAKTNSPRSTITEVSSSPYSSTIRPIWNDRREIPEPRVPHPCAFSSARVGFHDSVELSISEGKPLV